MADLTASLAEAAAAHVAEVSKRVPGATLVVQLDEPSLTTVVNGEVPTASGLSRIAVPDAADLSERLHTVLAATGRYSVLHCCACPVPFGIIMAAQPDAVSFDLSLVRREDGDLIAELADAGKGIFAGAVRAILPPQHQGGPARADGPAHPPVLACPGHESVRRSASDCGHPRLWPGRRDPDTGRRSAGPQP